jgi:CheY-like chemotaxis protein
MLLCQPSGAMTSTSRDRLLVLVADDDDDMRAVVVDALRADGCTTV